MKIKLPLTSLNYLVAIVIVLILSLFIRFNSSRLNVCDIEEMMKSKTFNGIVTAKYIDKQDHGNQVIEISNFDNTKLKLEFNNEISGFYSSIRVSDTLSKKEGSIDVVVKNKQYKVYTLNYNCNKEL